VSCVRCGKTSPISKNSPLALGKFVCSDCVTEKDIEKIIKAIPAMERLESCLKSVS
jgi:NMD protein affecting ribosome stability and mRNA decay